MKPVVVYNSSSLAGQEREWAACCVKFESGEPALVWNKAK
jgi:hypothetical protein